MKKRIVGNNLFTPTIIYMIAIIIFISLNFLIYNENTKIVSNIIIIFLVQIFIFSLFKLDFISSITLFVVWALIPSIIVYYGSPDNYGDLSLNFVPIYLYKDTIYVFIFIMVLSLFAYFFKINLYEKQIIHEQFPTLNNITINVNNIIAIIFTFIAFPTIPSFSGISVGANRFQMLLPGHAWNQLVIVALLFNLPYFTKKISIPLTYLFTMGWFLMHGERADISGVLFGVLILILFSKRIKFSKKLIYFLFSLFLAVLLISIGYARINGHFPSFSNSLNGFATFSTVTDISYLINVSVDYINNIGLIKGQIFLKTILSAIPFIDGSRIVSNYIEPFYPNPGGSALISSELMDGGSVGIIVITLFYSYLLKFILNKNSLLFKYEFLLLICSIPRISWYGINYVFTSMIFFVPFMYYLNRYLNNN